MLFESIASQVRTGKINFNHPLVRARVVKMMNGRHGRYEHQGQGNIPQLGQISCGQIQQPPANGTKLIMILVEAQKQTIKPH